MFQKLAREILHKSKMETNAYNVLDKTYYAYCFDTNLNCNTCLKF